MTGLPLSFDAIMAPLGGERFLAGYLGRQPLHLRASPDKWQALMGWDELNRLLGMTTIWSQNSLALMLDRQPVPPASYSSLAEGRDGGKVLRPDPVRVERLLGQGATLVLNDIDQLTPALSDFCRVMEAALGAKLQANLYLSSQRRQGFKVHYDTHDVFAVHVMGEKTWMVFVGRSLDPIAHPLFKDLPDEHHEAAKGELWREVRLQPGDLLYLPRGQYHYALADDEPCAHIAFGATFPIGLDVIGHLFERMVQEPIARANLPADAAALRERLAALAERARTLLADDATCAAIRTFQAGFRYPRDVYHLPNDLAPALQRYRRKAVGLRLVRGNSRPGLLHEGTRRVIDVPEGIEPLLAWTLQQEGFTRQELAAAFATQDHAALDRFLAEILRMGIVEPET